MIHVKTKIDRADKDLIAELGGTFSAATIHEAQGRKGVAASGDQTDRPRHEVLRLRLHSQVPSP